MSRSLARVALVLLLAIWADQLTIAAPTSVPRYVFAHYMVCCPRDGLAASPAAYEREISDASRLGIDGFALNIGSWKKEDKYIRVPLQLFEAAKIDGRGFKLFFSFDGLGVEESAEILKRFYGHPNYLKVDGKAVVSSYGGDPAWGTRLRSELGAAQIEILLIPFYYYAHQNPLAKVEPWGSDFYVAKRALSDADDIDGYFYFGAAGRDPELSQRLHAIGLLVKRQQRICMLGVSPFYKGFGPQNSRVFESHGFESMQAQWMAAINANADWVELVTWNDWGEATYLAPFGAPRDQSLWNGHWGKLLAHDKFLEASAYYIEWFKRSSAPTIEVDRLFYFYRVHPKSALGVVVPSDGRLGRPSGADDLDDAIYVTAYLKQPAELNISAGGVQRIFHLQSGVANVRVPIQFGSTSISLVRDGELIGSKQLEFDITYDGTRGNFNYFAGSLP